MCTIHENEPNIQKYPRLCNVNIVLTHGKILISAFSLHFVCCSSEKIDR